MANHTVSSLTSGTCNFTHAHYQATLALAKKKGYRFFRLDQYGEARGKQKVIFLRHDIDFNPQLALTIAKIEKKLGIHATYFFRVHAAYNLYAPANYKALRQIMSFGHEIGLHYEQDFSMLSKEGAIPLIKRDKRVLEAITNRPITGCCAHEPGRRGHLITGRNLAKAGFTYHAYADAFLAENKYISDSGCRWREGCMCSFIGRDTPRLYILTHPFWWYAKSPIENY